MFKGRSLVETSSSKGTQVLVLLRWVTVRSSHCSLRVSRKATGKHFAVHSELSVCIVHHHGHGHHGDQHVSARVLLRILFMPYPVSRETPQEGCLSDLSSEE